MICIYAIINIIDDKCYLGQTEDRDYRWFIHRKELRGFYHHSILLQRAWCKYGESNFIFVVLEVLNDISQLDDKEVYWGKLLNPEYNIAPLGGSMRGYKHTEEAKENMSKSHIGKSWHTENSRKLAAERLRGNTYNNGRKQTAERIEARAKLHRGKPKSDEHKAKIAFAQKGRVFTEEHKQKLRKPKRKKSLDEFLKLGTSIATPSLSGS